MKHGGNLAEARARFGEPVRGWLDLSTGINPLAYPFEPPPGDAWTRLPQAEREAALVAAARGCYRTGPDAAILAAPGTQILIQLSARLRPAARVAIVSPTYSEHAIAWAREGADVIAADTLQAGWATEAEVDVVVCVNPNNPDGRVWPRDALLAVAEELAGRGGLLIVDEAFADVRPEISVADAAGRPGLIVLRSFGKFFGLAGVRLGFAIGHDADIARLAGWLGPWAVPGPAIEIGIAALSDIGWQAAMRARIGELGIELDRTLTDAGLTVVADAGLFRLVQHPEAQGLHDRLCHAGILTRRFEDQPRWLRFGLADEAGLARLARAFGSLTCARSDPR